MSVTLLCLVALLAFANGSNDNGKGVATLVGHGSAKPWPALLWATVTTALGGLFSFWFAAGLLKSFSTGLFTTGTALDARFFIAVLCGAFGWVIFATLTGMPVSTTHAITGALTGAGMVAFGSASFQWTFLRTKFAVPLAVSPVLSLGVVYLLAWPMVYGLTRLTGWCACVVREPVISAGAIDATGAMATSLSVMVGTEPACADRESVAAVTTTATADAIHWASSGLVGFARGWNDTPKIAALSLIVLSGRGGMMFGFALVTIAMAAGGLLAGRKVLTTLSKKVTPLPLAESLTASLCTAALVSLASWHALPVSTTHVSTGAIIGAGLKNDPRSVRWGKVGEIVLSWVITLPVAALIAAGVKLVLKQT